MKPGPLRPPLRLDQYAHFGRANGANPIAAAAKAAHDVLVAVYPAQQATLDAELATWVARVPLLTDRPGHDLELGLEVQPARVLTGRRLGHEPAPTTRSDLVHLH